jgi:hypothetical protein
MYCGGGHLGFPIDITNIDFVEDLPMIIYVFCSDMKFKMAATAGLSLTLDPMGKMFQNASFLKPLLQFRNFVEDLPMTIPGQFGFNCKSGFRKEAF